MRNKENLHKVAELFDASWHRHRRRLNIIYSFIFVLSFTERLENMKDFFNWKIYD